MTSALEGGEWSAASPGRTLPPGKTRYPLYRRLGGPKGRFGQAENLTPTGIRSPDPPASSQISNGSTFNFKNTSLQNCEKVEIEKIFCIQICDVNWLIDATFVAQCLCFSTRYINLMFRTHVIPPSNMNWSVSLFAVIAWNQILCPFAKLDRLCGLVVRVSGYRYRGLGFDSRRYQILWVVVGLKRGPLSLVSSIEELLE